MKQLTIVKTSSTIIMTIEAPDTLTIQYLRDFIKAQPDNSNVSEIKNGNEFSFELGGDQGVTYTLK